MLYIPSPITKSGRLAISIRSRSSRFSIPAIIRYLGDTIGIQASFRYLSIGTLLDFVCVNLFYSPRIYQQHILDPATGD